jgi:CBS domain-containing protein
MTLMDWNSYEEINDFRLHGIALAARNNECLNEFHDTIYEQVISLALERTLKNYGPPPSSFTFFVMGSAGRYEQSIWSDQDHGLIYMNDNSESKIYFSHLGLEISQGLDMVGYPKCHGGVMAENLLWCMSFADWENQLRNWSVQSTWESIRYLLIFADARRLFGPSFLLADLKEEFFSHIQTQKLTKRMLQNTMHVKKGIGLLGQLLVETHGENSGAINLKDTAFFPFVNSARLLAINNRIAETSTLARLKLISGKTLTAEESGFFSNEFSRLLDFRLRHGNHFNYETGHYVSTDKLTRAERKELKDILKAGEQLYIKAGAEIEKDRKDGYE